jgi:two-component system nitrogen regulation response regulator GlnG
MRANWRTLARRLAALYPQETINEALVDLELAQPPASSHWRRAGVDSGADTLGESVERHLFLLISASTRASCRRWLQLDHLKAWRSRCIAALAATRGNQIKAAELLGLNRNTL